MTHPKRAMRRRGQLAVVFATALVGCNLLVGIGDLPGPDTPGDDGAVQDTAMDTLVGPTDAGDSSLRDATADGVTDARDGSVQEATADTLLVGPTDAEAGVEGGPMDSATMDACSVVDSGSDPMNCGTCGHDCLGGACLGGVCQPIEIASGQADPRSIVVDPLASGRVYWTTYAPQGAVMAANKDGSNAAPLVSAQPFAQSLSYDGTWIAWTTGNTAGAFGVNVSDTSGNWRTLAFAQTTAPTTFATAVSAGVVYWSGYAAGTVNALAASAPSCTGAACPVLVGSQSPGPTAVVANAAGVYWVGTLPSPGDAGYLGYVAAAELDGAAPRILTTGQGDLLGVAAAPGALYWTDNTGEYVEISPLDGGATTPFAQNQQHPLGIAVDSTRVYWTNLVGSGAIMSAHLDGTNARPIATNVLDGWGIAVDDVAVYWVAIEGPGPDGGPNTEANGGVWKVAK